MAPCVAWAGFGGVGGSFERGACFATGGFGGVGTFDSGVATFALGVGCFDGGTGGFACGFAGGTASHHRKLYMAYSASPGVPGPVAAYDTRTGALLFVLPAGITSANGRLHYVARARRADTVVSRHVVSSGVLEDWFVVAGRWRIATRRISPLMPPLLEDY